MLKSRRLLREKSNVSRYIGTPLANLIVRSSPFYIAHRSLLEYLLIFYLGQIVTMYMDVIKTTEEYMLISINKTFREDSKLFSFDLIKLISFINLNVSLPIRINDRNSPHILNFAP